MRQRPEAAGGVGELVAREHRGQAQHAAGQGLADAHQVRRDARALAGELRAGAAEAGGDLVGDQRHAALGAGGRGMREEGRLVDVEAAGALQHRLEDHAGQFRAVRVEVGVEAVAGGAQFGRAAADRRRPRREMLLRQQGAEARMQGVVRIADRHRGEGVAVVAAAQRQEAAALGAAVGLGELQRDLQRHLDRHRAGIAEEHPSEPPARERRQPRRQPRRRLVGQAAEHDVRQRVGLGVQRGDQFRRPVAVHRAPPGGHAVDQAAAVGQPQAGALAADHRHRGRVLARPRVGVPQVPRIQRGPRGRQRAQVSFSSSSWVMAAVASSIREAEQYFSADRSIARCTLAWFRPAPVTR